MNNKYCIYNKISEQSYESMIYMDELITRMLKHYWFKKDLLRNSSINKIKQILIEYMDATVLDDYYIYLNFRNEPEDTFYNNRRKYKENLINSLYDLGYRGDTYTDLTEYVQKCLDLQQELKDSIKSKSSLNNYKIKNESQIILKSEKKQNTLCLIM